MEIVAGLAVVAGIHVHICKTIRDEIIRSPFMSITTAYEC